MVKLIFLLFCFLSFLAPVSFAQEVAKNNVTNATNNEPTSQVALDVENKSEIDNTQNLNSSNGNGTNVIEKTPEVGKHVNVKYECWQYDNVFINGLGTNYC